MIGILPLFLGFFLFIWGLTGLSALAEPEGFVGGRKLFALLSFIMMCGFILSTSGVILLYDWIF